MPVRRRLPPAASETPPSAPFDRCGSIDPSRYAAGFRRYLQVFLETLACRLWQRGQIRQVHLIICLWQWHRYAALLSQQIVLVMVVANGADKSFTSCRSKPACTSPSRRLSATSTMRCETAKAYALFNASRCFRCARGMRNTRPRICSSAVLVDVARKLINT